MRNSGSLWGWLRWTLGVVAMTSVLSVGAESDTESSGEPLHVPLGDGRPVMIDGIFHDSEWDDAMAVPIDQGSTMLLKRYRGTLYIGFRMAHLSAPVFDLYVSPESARIHQFHVSAQLGERQLDLAGDQAADPVIDWGKVDRWIANQMRWNEGRLQQIMAEEGLSRMEVFPRVAAPCQGAEFQFLEEKLGSQALKIRLEVKSGPDYSASRVFPPRTDARKTEGWLTLTL